MISDQLIREYMNTGEASRKIAKILSELEKSTGCIVANLSIENIDVTTLGDPSKQIKRSVNIEIELKPGAEWIT